MPTATYIPLANVTLGSAAASVTFSSITQSYRDLVLVGKILAGTSAAAYTYLCLNSAYVNTYGRIEMIGNGTGASSTSSAGDYPYLGYDVVRSNSQPMQFTVNINDYSATDKYKSGVYRVDTPTGNYPGTAAGVIRNSSNSAITSLLIQSGVDNFPSGSSFALYGVSA